MKFLALGLALISLASASALPNPERVSYDGWKAFRVKTGIAVDDVLKKLSNLSFDQWNHDVDEHVDIVLAPDQLDEFAKLDLDFETMHEDLGASIVAESAGQTSLAKRQVDLSWFNSYHPYADHQTWLQQLRAKFPGNSELISSGRSYQGRDLFGIHIWGNTKNTKPAVLWHGTVHAREWISAMVIPILRLGQFMSC
jgi:Zinc carboxypeptidase/Carboxypeptidase activation peptide